LRAISGSDESFLLLATRSPRTGSAEHLQRKQGTSLNSPIGTIQDSGMRPLKAGLIYFLLIFALGWVLGPAQELLAVPRFGRMAALLVEAAIMLIAMIVSLRWLIRRFGVPRRLAQRCRWVWWRSGYCYPPS